MKAHSSLFLGAIMLIIGIAALSMHDPIATYTRNVRSIDTTTSVHVAEELAQRIRTAVAQREVTWDELHTTNEALTEKVREAARREVLSTLRRTSHSNDCMDASEGIARAQSTLNSYDIPIDEQLFDDARDKYHAMCFTTPTWF